MLKREFLENQLGYKYLKNSIYKKEWYGRIIMLDANNNKGYVKNENIYVQNDIDELQLALNVLKRDLKRIKEFKENHDLYDIYKLKNKEVLEKSLVTFNKLLEIESNNESLLNHIRIIENIIKEREER